MPKNSKKKQEINSQELKKKVDQDLVVHNMPANRGLVSSSGLDTSGNQQMSEEKKHFKTIGVVIIVGGIILVGVLIYLSYKFIISPASNSNQTQVNTSQQQLVEENINNVVSSTESDGEEFSGQEEQVPLSIASSTPSGSIEIDEGEQNQGGEVDNLDNPAEEDGQNEIDNEEELVPILDADSDGLSDDEENALFTSLFQADSDGDGYYDLSEIENGYNPSGEGLLEDSSALTRYYNSVANYSLLYPANWSLASSNNDYTIVISTPDNSLMQISVQDNARLQGILSWYEETIGQSADYDKLMSKDGWEGIMGENDQNFYLTDESRVNIYVISYIPAISERLNYKNIFDVMVNSFRIE